ncbi:hypothetical protein [Parabacteroides timonensis]|uniref:hypothetical protein n=1 Tax=Parabacteroides timonensis TaxID=1871013 RepID=UPI00094F30AE|nr:hypothetical protein [Parabacteroides timonensis]
MRHYTLYSIGRLLALSCVLLIGGTGKAWGQYTITPQAGKSFPQDDVPTTVDTIYIADNETRVFQIPELVEFTSNKWMGDYRWYTRWYRVNEEGNVLSISNRFSNGKLKNATSGNSGSVNSLFWYHGFSLQNTNLSEIGQVTYTSNGDNDILICDISHNIDGLGWHSPDGSSPTVLTEPTISKRYRYIIRNSGVISERLSKVQTDAALDTFYITIPNGAENVNLQLDMGAKNYYWTSNSRQRKGDHFVYKKEGGQQIAIDEGKQIINIQESIKTDMTVDVFAYSNRDGFLPASTSPCIARYIITPQDDSGFELEENIEETNEYRNPGKFDRKYEQIGYNNFDIIDKNGGLTDSTVTQLTPKNNMSMTPLDYEESTYGFVNPGLASISEMLTPKRDHYGLYRSANVSDPAVSDRKRYDVEGWAQGIVASYDGGGTIQSSSWTNRMYDWFFGKTSTAGFYDRTYEETKNGEKKYGFFFYVDAAVQPGRIVNIPLAGTMCGGTELTVIAWVSDLSEGQKTKPNLNFILRGVDKLGDEIVKEEVLHRFSTGDPEGYDYAKWMQVCYRIIIPRNKANYGEYSLEIQNNTLDSNGADYAIDDIRIYKTLPNVSVQRADACSASTLIVSSDYATLLRNMGWNTNGGDVLKGVDLTKPYNRKYRYGLMGGDPYADSPQNYVGNVYFGFTDKIGAKREDGATDVDGSKAEDWITINKDLEKSDDPVLQGLSKSIRVVVPTSKNADVKFPQDKNTAISDEILMNIRAMNDFLSDTEEKSITKPDGTKVNITIWNKDTLNGFNVDSLKIVIKKLLEGISINTENGHITGSIEVTDGNRDTFKAHIDSIKAEGTKENLLYERWIRKFYSFLRIPRIRCPWVIETTDHNYILYLHSINVDNTELRFAGELLGKNAETNQPIYAEGKYDVVLFNAAQVVGSGGNEDQYDSNIDFTDPCLLNSSFIVQPSITIALDGETHPNDHTCLNSIHTLEAELWVNEVDDYGNLKDKVAFSVQFSDQIYTFDWFLGTASEYEEVTKKLKATYPGVNDKFANFLKALRNTLTDEQNKAGTLTAEIIRGSSFYTNGTDDQRADAEYLIRLRGGEGGDPKLVSGKKVSIRWVNDILAIPYVKDFTVNDKLYSVCTKPQRLTLGGNDADPKMAVGYNDVEYDDISLNEVPLRLGLENVTENSKLQNIPIQGNRISFGSGGNRLDVYPDKNEVLLRMDDDTYNPIATLNELSATQKDGGTLTMTFNRDAATYLEEGETYRLYIPFGEYDDNVFVSNSCEGYAVLVIKVVPKYLTWDPKADNEVWYNDKNWYASTKDELYSTTLGETDTETKQLAPLYFTKVTVLGKEKLSLDISQQANHVLQLTNEQKKQATKDIQYDMAVLNAGGEISPYYINKVSEIYLKPEATLMNQHRLDYEKAWVEFEIKNNGKRWFASPLRDVYAGDFYAPKTTGRQETAAFTGITYDAQNTNSRWAPAFYQKAWNSAVNYATQADGSTHESVAIVKSNWSIEYNDVTVKYPVGKGFYLSVKDVPQDNGGNGTALVRLPKADESYSYEPATKAASDMTTIASRTNSGQLAAYKGENGSLSDGEVTVKLSDLFGEADGDVIGEGGTSKKRHFLVGNPYMTYLKMEEFFTGNKIFANKYWTLTDGTVSATVVGTPDIPFENAYTTGTVAPMQAFFVELAENAEVKADTEITFTPEMMSATPITAGSTATKAFAASNPVITITAEQGEARSRSILTVRDRADNGYKADEDAVVLLDSELDAPMVYTVAGSKAAQVNAVRSIRNIGLGVYNEAGGEVTVTIEGISRLTGRLYLYDAQEKKSTELTGDSHTLRLGGSTHGRYFLRSDDTPAIGIDDISIYSAEPGKVVVSTTDRLERIQVVTLSGQVIRGFSPRQATCTFDLPQGIYVIRAESGQAVKTEKVRVR